MKRFVKGPFKCDGCGGEIRNEKAIIRYNYHGGGVYARYHIRCDPLGEGDEIQYEVPKSYRCPLCLKDIPIDDPQRYDEIVDAHLDSHIPKKTK